MMKPEKDSLQEKIETPEEVHSLTPESRSPEAEQAGIDPLPEAKATLAEMQDVLSRLERIAIMVEQSKLHEYVNYLENPRLLIRINLFMGIARGFGFAVGLTVLSAVVIYIFQWVIRMNLPLISKFVADIFYLANQYLTLYGR